jgi:hypothetical protein
MLFWINNLNELFNFTLIPTNYMTFEDKMNTILRLILFIGIIATLIFNDYRYLLMIIIIFMMSVFIYNFQMNNIKNAEKFLDNRNLDVVDNKVCAKSTVDNPFMNPSLLDIKHNPNKPAACSIDDNFYKRLYRDVGDLYGKMSSEREFYTVPCTTIPNDQEGFGKWLYDRGTTCKENNGEQCYRNIH